MQSIMDNSKRCYWVDFAKFMAIIAVMIDHTNGLLYTDQRIAYFSYYSVELFILMMGVTSYWSYSRYNGSVITKVGKGCWKISRPYLVATLIYSILIDRQFHFVNYLIRVIHFNACEPFYYVLLYLQLLVLTPVLCAILKFVDRFKYGFLIEVLGLIMVLIISSWTTNNSNILDVFGSGGKLFGGTELVMLYIGMVFGKHCEKISVNKKLLVVYWIICSALTIMWWNFISIDNLQIDLYLPYGDGFNPPSISLGLYAIFMACTIYLLGKVLNESAPFKKVFESVSVLGRHTLYIFLYHCMFLDFTFPHFFARTGIVVSNIWLLRIVYFLGMTVGSIVIEIVLERMHMLLKRIYMPKPVDMEKSYE